jgi:hypothetical protein
MSISTLDLAALRERLAGSRVTDKRHVLLTLLLYVEPDGSPNDIAEIWFEPSWQVRGPVGVIAGSGTLELAPEEVDPAAEYSRVSVATDVLRGRRVQSIDVDLRTHELSVMFEGDFAARTFVDDPAEPDPLWRIRERGNGVEVQGRSTGVSVAAV